MSADPAMLGASAHERREGDFYPTPAWCSETLLRLYPMPPLVWEPACGDGAIVQVLRRHGMTVHASDLSPRMSPARTADFFLAESAPEDADAIITNPPYTHARAFVERALELMQPRKGVVAMLLRNEYDSADTRRHLFGQAPFAAKIVLTRRPMWIAGTSGSPRHNYSWFVWDWKHEGAAVLRYGK